MYEPVEALHVVISCDCQYNLYINVLLIVILVTSFCTFSKIFLFIFWTLQSIISQQSPPVSQCSLPIGLQAFEWHQN